jgi:hypothetical protein
VAIAQNHFLVSAPSQLYSAVLAILSVRVLESCRGSEAWQARIVAKSCAGYMLAGWSRFAALRRGSKPRRIGLVARPVPCRLVYVGRLVFPRFFRGCVFRCEAGRVALLSLLAGCFCNLPFVLRPRFCSGPTVPSRGRGRPKSNPESTYGYHKIIFRSVHLHRNFHK